MNFFGSFLTFGAERAPEVVLLDQLACDKLEARINVAHGGEKIRLAAYEATFGKGVEYALPCWSNECMRAVALQYSGPQCGGGLSYSCMYCYRQTLLYLGRGHAKRRTSICYCTSAATPQGRRSDD